MTAVINPVAMITILAKNTSHPNMNLNEKETKSLPRRRTNVIGAMTTATDLSTKNHLRAVAETITIPRVAARILSTREKAKATL